MFSKNPQVSWTWFTRFRRFFDAPSCVGCKNEIMFSDLYGFWGNRMCATILSAAGWRWHMGLVLLDIFLFMYPKQQLQFVTHCTRTVRTVQYLTPCTREERVNHKVFELRKKSELLFKPKEKVNCLPPPERLQYRDMAQPSLGMQEWW